MITTSNSAILQSPLKTPAISPILKRYSLLHSRSSSMKSPMGSSNVSDTFREDPTPFFDYKKAGILESKLKKLTLIEGVTSEYGFKIANELAKLYNNHGSKLLHLLDFKKCEDFLLKAKQITESVVFHLENELSWQLLRLSILKNLATFYRRINKNKLGYYLLKDVAKTIKSDKFLEDIEACLSGLDSFYLNIAILCFKQSDYHESLWFIDNAIRFSRGILRNSELLNSLNEKFILLGKNLQSFLNLKNCRLAYMLYLKSINLEREKQFDDSIYHVAQAFHIAKEYLGEDSNKTIKYKEKYDYLLTKITKSNKIKIKADKIKIKINNDTLDESHKKVKKINLKINTKLNESPRKSCKDFIQEENPDYFSESDSSLDDNATKNHNRRRSSLFRFSYRFFEHKIHKKCGCLDKNEITLAKVNLYSQRIYNEFKVQSEKNTKFMDRNLDKIKQIEAENQHKHEGHHHHHDEDDEMQSFCAAIFNKNLNRNIKNRHLNNHDMKRLMIEATENLYKMQNIIKNHPMNSPSLTKIIYPPKEFSHSTYHNKNLSITKSIDEFVNIYKTDRKTIKRPKNSIFKISSWIDNDKIRPRPLSSRSNKIQLNFDYLLSNRPSNYRSKTEIEEKLNEYVSDDKISLIKSKEIKEKDSFLNSKYSRAEKKKENSEPTLILKSPSILGIETKRKIKYQKQNSQQIDKIMENSGFLRKRENKRASMLVSSTLKEDEDGEKKSFKMDASMEKSYLKSIQIDKKEDKCEDEKTISEKSEGSSGSKAKSLKNFYIPESDIPMTKTIDLISESNFKPIKTINEMTKEEKEQKRRELSAKLISKIFRYYLKEKRKLRLKIPRVSLKSPLNMTTDSNESPISNLLLQINQLNETGSQGANHLFFQEFIDFKIKSNLIFTKNFSFPYSLIWRIFSINYELIDRETNQIILNYKYGDYNLKNFKFNDFVSYDYDIKLTIFLIDQFNIPFCYSTQTNLCLYSNSFKNDEELRILKLFILILKDSIPNDFTLNIIETSEDYYQLFSQILEIIIKNFSVRRKTAVGRKWALLSSIIETNSFSLIFEEQIEIKKNIKNIIIDTSDQFLNYLIKNREKYENDPLLDDEPSLPTNQIIELSHAYADASSVSSFDQLSLSPSRISSNINSRTSFAEVHNRFGGRSIFSDNFKNSKKFSVVAAPTNDQNNFKTNIFKKMKAQAKSFKTLPIKKKKEINDTFSSQTALLDFRDTINEEDPDEKSHINKASLGEVDCFAQAVDQAKLLEDKWNEIELEAKKARNKPIIDNSLFQIENNKINEEIYKCYLYPFNFSETIIHFILKNKKNEFCLVVFNINDFKNKGFEIEKYLESDSIDFFIDKSSSYFCEIIFSSMIDMSIIKKKKKNFEEFNIKYLNKSIDLQLFLKRKNYEKSDIITIIQYFQNKQRKNKINCKNVLENDFTSPVKLIPNKKIKKKYITKIINHKITYINIEKIDNSINLKLYEPFNYWHQYKLKIDNSKFNTSISNDSLINFEDSFFGKKIINYQNKISNYFAYYDYNNLYLKNQFLLCDETHFIHRNYAKKTLFSQSKISGIDKCYIKIIIFTPLNFINLENTENYIKFELFPIKDRNKMYKFLLNDKEISFYLKENFDYKNSNILNKLKKGIFDKFFIGRSGILYKRLNLKLNRINYHLQMDNGRNSYDKKYNKIIYNNNKPILQFFKKIHNEFFIFTIIKNILLNKWIIQFYVIKSNKNYQCFLDKFDLNKICNNNSKEFYDKNLTIRINAWKKITQNIKISIRNNNKLALNLNNCYFPIREVLINEMLIKKGLKNKDHLIYYEIFLNGKTPIQISQKMNCFRFWELKNHFFLIRITSVNPFLTINKKILMSHLLYSYIFDEKLNLYKNFNSEYLLNKFEFNQSIINELIRFIAIRLKTNKDFLNYYGSSFEEKGLKFDKFQILKPGFSEFTRKKLNGKRNNYFKKNSINENRYFLIYRGVFTLKPLQIIVVSYFPKKKLFLFTVFNNFKSRLFEKNYKLNELEQNVYYIEKLLDLKLFDILGKRLINFLKIKLMISSYLVLK